MIPVWDDLTHVERLDGKAGVGETWPRIHLELADTSSKDWPQLEKSVQDLATWKERVSHHQTRL